MDEALLLHSSDRLEINRVAAGLLSQAASLYVVTIPSLAAYDADAYSIEEYAREIFNHWGIGRADSNRGMLLLIARENRRARIELGAGYGREHDRTAERIMDDLIIPEFRRRRFSEGILNGVRGLDGMVHGRTVSRSSNGFFAREKKPYLLFAAATATLFTVLFIYLIQRGRYGLAAFAVALGIAALLAIAATCPVSRSESLAAGGIGLLGGRRRSRGGSGFGGGFSRGGGASGRW